MSYTISNQKPAVLDPVHTIPIAGDYDPETAVRKAIVDPLFEPRTAGGTVSIADAKGTRIDEDHVHAVVMQAIGETVDLQAEDFVKDLLQQGLIHYDKNNPVLVNELFVAQAAHSAKLPNPGPRVIYTAGSDVIPAAKTLLAGGAHSDDELFASLAYTYSPETLAFWFVDEAQFDDFKGWVTSQAQVLGSVLPGETTNLLAKFAQLKLNGLTEGLVLRVDDSLENEEYSFARVIVNLAMAYQRTSGAGFPATGVLPFAASELFLPRTILMVNVEAHARATPKRVDNEWKLVRASLASPVKVISKNSLSKLTAMPRAMAKAAALSANAASNRQAHKARSAKVVFRKQPPNSVDIVNDLLKALKRMKRVNFSQNVLKTSRISFSKANRRHPDDPNRPGRVTSNQYLPDIHIFLDTSGSISEVHYQQAVKMLIKMAKKLDVNLYFSSFSHLLSTETMLHTKGRSLPTIWKQFSNTPKVTGGTDFAQIWRYISASKERRSRLSIIITDFEWSPGTQRVDHPKNLYYAPCSNMDWNQMVYAAERLVRSSRHIEPDMPRRLFGMAK